MKNPPPGSSVTVEQRFPAVVLEHTPECWLESVDIIATFLTRVDLVASSDISTGSVRQQLKPDETPGSVPLRFAVGDEARNRRLFNLIDADQGFDPFPKALAIVEESWLLEQFSDLGEGCSWSLVGAEVQMHDFGIATMRLRWCPPVVPSAYSEAGLNSALEHVDTHSWKIFQGATQVLTEALATSLPDVAPAVLADDHDELTKSLFPHVGVALWSSLHISVAAMAGTEADVARAVARSVGPYDHTILEHRGHAYAMGVSRCVTISSPELAPKEIVLRRAMQQQDAWWTLYWALDRILQRTLNTKHNRAKDAVAIDVARELDEISALSRRMAAYSSRVESMLVATGARDLKVWKLLSEHWELEFRKSSVEHKLRDLRLDLADVISVAEQQRANRINRLVLLFTAFGVVASSISVTEYINNSETGSLAIRLALLFGCIAVALASVGFTSRGSARRRLKATGAS